MLIRRTRKAAAQRRQADLAGRTLVGLVDAGLLMAAADGELAQEELDVLAGVIDGFCEGQVTGAQIRDLLDSAIGALERDGWEGRLGQLAGNLPHPDLRYIAATCAASVMISDGAFAEGAEDEAYGTICEALGLSESAATAALDEAAAMWD